MSREEERRERKRERVSERENNTVRFISYPNNSQRLIKKSWVHTNTTQDQTHSPRNIDEKIILGAERARAESAARALLPVHFCRPLLYSTALIDRIGDTTSLRGNVILTVFSPFFF